MYKTSILNVNKHPVRVGIIIIFFPVLIKSIEANAREQESSELSVLLSPSGVSTESKRAVSSVSCYRHQESAPRAREQWAQCLAIAIRNQIAQLHNQLPLGIRNGNAGNGKQQGIEIPCRKQTSVNVK